MSSASSQKPSAPIAPGLWAALLCAALLLARGMIPESFELVDFAFLSTARDLPGPTPVTTAWLDWLTLTTASVAWGLGGPSRLSRSVRLGIAGLLAATLVTAAWAEDRRVALNAGAELVLIAFAVVTLIARGMRSPALPRWLAAGLIAVGCANAAKCLAQRASEFRETYESWMERKQEGLAAGAFEANPAMENYERRLRSAEAFGLLQHPNVTGSCMGMGLVACLGAFLASLREPRGGAWRRLAPVVASAGVGLLGAGIWMTGSRGAMAASLLGACVTLVMFGLRTRGSWSPRLAWRIACAGYLAGLLALFGYGAARGTLPGESLAFRWQYWSSALSVFREAPLGVGRENFISGYLRHKAPEATEEVRNPHNVWVTLAVELGPLGLLGGALLLAAGAWAAVKNSREPHENAVALQTPSVAPVVIASLAIQFVASGTLELIGRMGAEHGLAVGFELLRSWILQVGATFTIAFVLADGLLKPAQNTGWGRLALWAGLAGAFALSLVHNVVEMSFFTPAGLACFAAASAAVAAWGREDFAGEARRRPGWLGTAALVVCCGLHLGMCVIPPARAARQLGRMEDLLASARSAVDVQAALDAGAAAISADPLDPEPAILVSRAALSLAADARAPIAVRRAWLGAAQSRLLAGLARFPRSLDLERLRARLLELALRDFSEQDRARIRDATPQGLSNQWQTVLSLYPSHVQALVEAGDAAFAWWEAGGGAPAAQAARARYEEALRIDGLRKADVAVKLPRGEIERVRGRLGALSGG